MAMMRMHALVYGRVQGVFFRSFVERYAISQRLCGFVRNLPDGSVEVIAEGEEDKLKKLEDELWKGPPLARVDNVSITYLPAAGDFTTFEIVL